MSDSTPQETMPEPWLRGTIDGVDPLIAPVLYAFQHAREDLARYTAPLTTAQIWARPHGFGSVGFHIRHIGGSVERLLTYLEAGALTREQLVALNHEHDSGATREELLAELGQSLREAETIIRRIHPATLAEVRFVGRKRLPTTVVGLLVHIAEHTQRHIGQAVVSAKWAAFEAS